MQLPTTTSKTQLREPPIQEMIADQIDRSQRIIALNKYFGFDAIGSAVTELENRQTYEFDFITWPKMRYIKVFAVLDKQEIEKYSRHPKAHRILFLLDGSKFSSKIKLQVRDAVQSYELDADAFEAANTLNAYLFFKGRIWSSHLGTNIWEPLLSAKERSTQNSL